MKYNLKFKRTDELDRKVLDVKGGKYGEYYDFYDDGVYDPMDDLKMAVRSFVRNKHSSFYMKTVDVIPRPQIESIGRILFGTGVIKGAWMYNYDDETVLISMKPSTNFMLTAEREVDVMREFFSYVKEYVGEENVLEEILEHDDIEEGGEEK